MDRVMLYIFRIAYQLHLFTVVSLCKENSSNSDFLALNGRNEWDGRRG
jgi:hypothetical protein